MDEFGGNCTSVDTLEILDARDSLALYTSKLDAESQMTTKE